LVAAVSRPAALLHVEQSNGCARKNTKTPYKREQYEIIDIYIDLTRVLFFFEQPKLEIGPDTFYAPD
jgi:hypothetical protein